MENNSTSELMPNRVALLTRRLAAGDEAAFQEFHEQYFDRLYQFLLVVTRGQDDEAQEALQQTLLRVLRYVGVFESEEAFWSWLKVVARSAARDAGRKQQRYSALLEKFALRWRGLADERTSSENDRLRTVLEESLDELEPDDRGLIEDKYIDGTTVKELSALAGLTEKAVESRLLRLRRHLRARVLNKLQSP
ncbi:MAG: sigma-70 family RNA polymerase sigma factor [Verrucomicrobia bacterium]|nr:sigma-70 family RNA polymerase sigma factor [Verrucomicrobiota bacterium]